MNEQEYMNKLKQKAENAPIPESISPENMKKMLDEHMTTTKPSKEQKKPTSSKKWLAYTTVACAMLLVVSGAGLTMATKNMIKQSETSMDMAQEACVEETGAAAEDDASDSDLACATDLNTPESYEEYYDTIKSNLDAYYDSFAQVQDSNKRSDLQVKDFNTSKAENSVVFEDAAMESGTNSDFSTTNIQEENIDEGDIIKTDGKYIYKVSTKIEDGLLTNTLSIIKTVNGKLTLESTIHLDSCFTDNKEDYVYFKEFYLYQNQLVLVFMNDFDKPETTIVIYDVTNKSNPVKKKVIPQSGSYESSRIHEGILYTISNFSNADFSTKKPYENYIPSVAGKLIDCSNIHFPENVLAESTYVVSSIDLNTLEVTDSIAVPTAGGQIYVSDRSIYIYGNVYSEPGKTKLLRVAYREGKLSPGKSTIITGYVYDSFALSEYNGYLRILATISPSNINLLREDSDMIPKTNATNDIINDEAVDMSQLTENINVLYILDENMSLVSKISGIAPGEQIKSVRYIGDMGYLVTYENVDPLFAIDLSDPENPEIKGRLTVPGFSNYLHPYADGLLFGLGEEYDPQTQTFEGLKISMFDISNPTNIQVKDQYILDEAYYAPAQYNHKALMINPEKNIIGFLYQEQVGADNGIYVTNCYFVTYEYQEDYGFMESGMYLVDTEDYDSDQVRGIYIGDYLYISTSNSVTSYQLNGEDAIDILIE
ncbi:MAG: beta-propeller domain-containing protein [Lachnospiraceae bacterium]